MKLRSKSPEPYIGGFKETGDFYKKRSVNKEISS